MCRLTSRFLFTSRFLSARWLAEEKSSSLSVRFWMRRPGLGGGYDLELRAECDRFYATALLLVKYSFHIQRREEEEGG